MLLALLHQLPSPLMPPAVSSVLARAVPPPEAAAALLSDTLAPAEWAVARHLLALLRAALAPPAAPGNGLSLPALAEALSGYLFAGRSGAPGARGGAPARAACHPRACARVRPS